MQNVINDNYSENISIRIPMKLTRRGGRKHVILPDGSDGRQTPKADTNVPLAVVVARAFCWQELFNSGKFSTMTELANMVGLERSYLARIMRITILAPDIVDAIMAGNEPSGLSFKKLTSKPIPILWSQQMKELGFFKTENYQNPYP